MKKQKRSPSYFHRLERRKQERKQEKKAEKAVNEHDVVDDEPVVSNGSYAAEAAPVTSEVQSTQQVHSNIAAAEEFVADGNTLAEKAAFQLRKLMKVQRRMLLKSNRLKERSGSV